MNSITIMTFNAGIWTRNLKKSDPNFWLSRMCAMRKMLLHIQPSVICFQEFIFPMNLFVPRRYRKVFGTGIQHPIYVDKESSLKSSGGRFHFGWSKAMFHGLNVYSLHSRWNLKWIQRDCRQLRDDYLQYPTTPFVIAGDFNNELDVFRGMLPETESARIKAGRPHADTYVHFDESRQQQNHGEIDHFMESEDINQTEYRIIPDSKVMYGVKRISDHYPLLLTIEN